MTEPTANEQSTSVSVETSITEVTVYTNRALVTRRGTLTLTGSEREIVIAGLPPTLEPESVRTGAVGSIKVQLLGVRSDRVFTTEPVAEKEAEITRQIREMENEFRAVQNQIQALQLQHTFVQNLSAKAVDRYSQSLARQQIDLEETGKLLNFLGQQYTGYAASIAEQEQKRNGLERQLKALRRQLEEVRIPNSKESFNLTVSIEPAGPGELELEISYVVNRASWTPLYDLRVNLTENVIGLSYLAEITQNSGEDWQGVKLTLSTAKPGLGTLPPKLNPWYIDVLKPTIIHEDGMMRRRGAPKPARAAAFGAPAPQPAIDLGDSLSDIQPFAFEGLEDQQPFGWEKSKEEKPSIKADNVAAEVVNEGGVVTFRLDRDSDIPGDNNPHKVTIFNDDFPCRAEYIAIPRLVSFAYLQTTVTNNSNGATLLPGTANIFRENVFVGTTRLENVAPGQEFKLNLGIDEGLKIERDLVEREVDKRLILNQRRITYAYRLTITNLREQETNLRLTEQLPVSRSEQIKVKLVKANPSLEPGEMGALEWNLTLAPKAKREIYYQFTVEHAPDLNLTGLSV